MIDRLNVETDSITFKDTGKKISFFPIEVEKSQ